MYEKSDSWDRRGGPGNSPFALFRESINDHYRTFADLRGQWVGWRLPLREAAKRVILSSGQMEMG
jgi:hypothetical protein